jgi:hypothetical protein
MVQSNFDPNYALAKDLSDLKNRLARLESQTNVTTMNPGGNVGLPLVKVSNLDFDTAWQVLEVPGGGTGATSLTGYVKGSGTSALTGVAKIPLNGGTDVTSQLPVANGGTGLSTATGYLKGAGSTVSAVTTVPVADGGTGAGTFTSGAYLKGAGTSAITAQTGIPATDITSGALAIARGGTGGTTGSGWIPITPTSVTGGGTNTINADGSVTMTSSTNTIFNGVFTSAYRNYKAIFTSSTNSNYPNAFYLRMTAGGTQNTTNSYLYSTFYIQGNSTAIGNFNTTLTNVGVLSFALDTEITFYAPQIARHTDIFFTSSYNYTTFIGNNYFATAAQFDGFQFFNNTTSGVMRIYGLL